MTSLEHLRNDGTLSQQERSLLFNNLRKARKGKFTRVLHKSVGEIFKMMSIC